MIDDRQYRAHNACHAESIRAACSTIAPSGSIPPAPCWGPSKKPGSPRAVERLGGWNLVAQQTLMAELDRGPGERHVYWADGWDGYPAARRRLLETVAASPTKDTLVLGGDVHSFWATDLEPDFADAKAPAVATEFVGGSITSQGPPNDACSPCCPRTPISARR